MSRRQRTFRQQDVTRALRAIKAAGEHVARAEIEPSGKIVMVLARGHTPDIESDNGRNPWDEVLIHAADEKRPS